MSDAPHTIPDHVAARVARLINEAEDMRQQAADDLKQIYADLRDELKGMGWLGSVVSAEVAALKGAIAEIRLDDEKKAKREEKGERVDDYVSLLSRARAREGQSYAEQKGRGVDAASTPPRAAETGELIERSSGDVFADLSVDPPGELTDNQEHETEVTTSRPEAAANSAADIDTPATGNDFADDVGATASSTYSHPHRTPARADMVEASTDKQAAGQSRPTLSNPQVPSPRPADSAGEAMPSSKAQASPATVSDLPISTTPSFAGRMTGEMPDMPASLDRRQPKARAWEDA